MNDMTHSEAIREAKREKQEREREAWQAKIIGSPVELAKAIRFADNELWINILRNIAHLTDMGFEMRQPGYDECLKDQSKDEIIELSQHIQQAIEEYISG